MHVHALACMPQMVFRYELIVSETVKNRRISVGNLLYWIFRLIGTFSQEPRGDGITCAVPVVARCLSQPTWSGQACPVPWALFYLGLQRRTVPILASPAKMHHALPG